MLYGCKKSHAVSYAIDSYDAAWLYTYYPDQCMSSFLESDNNSPQGLAKAIPESKALGYKFAPSDFNYSGDEWTYNQELKALMPPLSSIKGLGDKAMEEILEARPFTNLSDLFYNKEGQWRHSKVNKTCFEALCQIEAFSSLEEFKEGKIQNHRQLLEIIAANYENIRKGRAGEHKLRERLVRLADQIKEEFDKILRVYEKTKMQDLQEQASQHIYSSNIADWCYSEHTAELIKDLKHPNYKRQAQLDKCFERLENYYSRRDKIAERIDNLFNIEDAVGSVSHIEDWSRDEKIVLYQQITSAINNALVFPAEVMRRIIKADVKSICEMEGGDKGVAWGCASEIIKKKTKNGKEFYRIRMLDDQNRTAWLRVWGKFFDWGEERGQKVYYEPQPFSYWLMETEVDPNWGASSAAWKMRKIPLYDD